MICGKAIFVLKLFPFVDMAGNQKLQGNSDTVLPPPSAMLSVMLILNHIVWFMEPWQMECLAFPFIRKTTCAALERQDAFLLTVAEFCLINLPGALPLMSPTSFHYFLS